MIQARIKKTSGQAVIEYVLLTLFVIGIYTGLNYFTMKGVGNLWRVMAKQIAAGCSTGCQAPEEFN